MPQIPLSELLKNEYIKKNYDLACKGYPDGYMAMYQTLLSKRDGDSALEWLERGYARSPKTFAERLARAYENGYFSYFDPISRRSCEVGFAKGKDGKRAFEIYLKNGFNEQIGRCYYEGLGVGVDYGQAFVYLEKAEGQGESFSAKALLGDCYFYGRGVGQNYAEALKRYEEVFTKSSALGKDGYDRCRECVAHLYQDPKSYPQYSLLMQKIEGLDTPKAQTAENKNTYSTVLRVAEKLNKEIKSSNAFEKQYGFTDEVFAFSGLKMVKGKVKYPLFFSPYKMFCEVSKRLVYEWKQEQKMTKLNDVYKIEVYIKDKSLKTTVDQYYLGVYYLAKYFLFRKTIAFKNASVYEEYVRYYDELKKNQRTRYVGRLDEIEDALQCVIKNKENYKIADIVEYAIDDRMDEIKQCKEKETRGAEDYETDGFEEIDGVDFSTEQGKTKKLLLIGSGYNDVYEINSYGNILQDGRYTEYRLIGREIVLEENALKTIGFLIGSGSAGSVEYHNGHSGERPFYRWEYREV